MSEGEGHHADKRGLKMPLTALTKERDAFEQAHRRGRYSEAG